MPDDLSNFRSALRGDASALAAFDCVAFVGPHGSDATGQVGNPNRPFRTHAAAAAASADVSMDGDATLWVHPDTGGAAGTLSGEEGGYNLLGTNALRCAVQFSLPAGRSISVNGNGPALVSVLIESTPGSTGTDAGSVVLRGVNMTGVSLNGGAGAEGGVGGAGGAFIAYACRVAGAIAVNGGAGGVGAQGADATDDGNGTPADGSPGDPGGAGGAGGNITLNGCEIAVDTAGFTATPGDGGAGGAGGAGVNGGSSGAAGSAGSSGASGSITYNSCY